MERWGSVRRDGASFAPRRCSGTRRGPGGKIAAMRTGAPSFRCAARRSERTLIANIRREPCEPRVAIGPGDVRVVPHPAKSQPGAHVHVVARHPSRVAPDLAAFLDHPGQPGGGDAALEGKPRRAQPALAVVGEITRPAELPVPRDVEEGLEIEILRVRPQRVAEGPATVDEVRSVVDAVGVVPNARVLAQEMNRVRAPGTIAPESQLI